jgi:hypothetical protein
MSKDKREVRRCCSWNNSKTLTFSAHAVLPVIMLLLCGTALAAPSVEEKPIRVELEARDTAQEDARNERGLLYDDIELDAKTDGFSSDIQEDCRNNTVRYRRSDGRVITRKIDRCH